MWLYSDQWAAGFFDGEGCVQISPRMGKLSVAYYVTVQITQNDIRPLVAIQREFGGRLSPARPNALDRTSRWRASNLMAESFLLRIAPLLLVKREQAELALEMRRMIGDRRSFLDDAKREKRKIIYEQFRRTFAR